MDQHLECRRRHLVALAAVAGWASCASPEAEPTYGVIQYSATGGLHRDFDADEVVTHDAVEAALSDLGYDEASEGIDGNRFTAGNLVVDVRSFAPDFTRVEVTAQRQTEDDRVRARRILEELGDRLEARYRGVRGSR